MIPQTERSAYRKSPEIKLLEQLAFEYKRKQLPAIPLPAVVRPKFSDNSTNGLTEAVRAFLRVKGHHASRVNTGGQWRRDLGRFVHSGSTRGASDLNCIINGRSVQVEIKKGSDRLSAVQLAQKVSVEAAGGIYLEVRSFAAFIKEYLKITGKDYHGIWTLTNTQNNFNNERS